MSSRSKNQIREIQKIRNVSASRISEGGDFVNIYAQLDFQKLDSRMDFSLRRKFSAFLGIRKNGRPKDSFLAFFSEIG
ncbi:hypothetical protein LEP1GSC036_0768 [Leptospira weilii str. 2006001853]|uniref:Uncharacterized protein n=1 Tax=Leptospira weilii str. 2006001853 TaxID=1001589 RepID=A0A828Z7T3_9LEPT|nr:hypothetical protein LEP1GSC036_0768 [Leptospira weilii str. 2006001853]